MDLGIDSPETHNYYFSAKISNPHGPLNPKTLAMKPGF